MMSELVAVDTSVLVGLINPADLWHAKAIALLQQLQSNKATLVFFDCVIAEAVSVIARRLHEKKRVTAVNTLLTQLEHQFPAENITWILPQVPDFYADVLALMKQSNGALNFNDALIALACRERTIPAIASFDTDFDAIPWLNRHHSLETHRVD